jgi:cell division protein FtsB
MAKNRKNQSVGIRFGPAIKALLLCLVVGGSGIGYVWQKTQINDLGRQIIERETRLANLQNQNRKMRDQLAMLRSPQMLEQRAKELNLGLGLPQPSQIMRLMEPLPYVNRVPGQLAASNDRSMAMP